MSTRRQGAAVIRIVSQQRAAAINGGQHRSDRAGPVGQCARFADEIL